MWIHIKSKTTVNPEHDWTHTITLCTSPKEKLSTEESFPISILVSASKEKPLYVMYHMLDNGTCDIGPLLFTTYKDAYETFMKKIHHQYNETKDEIVVFQRFPTLSSNRISSSVYKTEGMKLLSRWNIDTITETTF
jgi:hypothetical protein